MSLHSRPSPSLDALAGVAEVVLSIGKGAAALHEFSRAHQFFNQFFNRLLMDILIKHSGSLPRQIPVLIAVLYHFHTHGQPYTTPTPTPTHLPRQTPQSCQHVQSVALQSNLPPTCSAPRCKRHSSRSFREPTASPSNSTSPSSRSLN